jgi:hypothetical protein
VSSHRASSGLSAIFGPVARKPKPTKPDAQGQPAASAADQPSVAAWETLRLRQHPCRRLGQSFASGSTFTWPWRLRSRDAAAEASSHPKALTGSWESVSEDQGLPIAHASVMILTRTFVIGSGR